MDHRYNFTFTIPFENENRKVYNPNSINRPTDKTSQPVIFYFFNEGMYFKTDSGIMKWRVVIKISLLKTIHPVS